MNYLTIFIISFSIALSGALMPGPLLATVIAESTKQGFKSGPLIILGHAILEILMVAFIILGFSRFIHNNLVLKVIFSLGAIILLYMGIKIIFSLPRFSLENLSGYKSSSNLILLGVTMSAANPYWTIWWLTIGMGLVLGAQKAGIIAICIFFTGHILADLGFYSIVSFVTYRGKRITSGKIYKGVILVCALTLIGFGIYFGAKSLKFPWH